MKRKKHLTMRILSMIMAVLMLATSLPLSNVFAAEPGDLDVEDIQLLGEEISEIVSEELETEEETENPDSEDLEVKESDSDELDSEVDVEIVDEPESTTENGEDDFEFKPNYGIINRELDPVVFPEGISAEASQPFYITEEINRASVSDSKYDSRNLSIITPVRDQNPHGTCWAHATIACIETNAVKKGLASVKSLDLSEQHVAFFTYNAQTNPLGLNKGDYISIPSGEDYMKYGGDAGMAGDYLMGWQGPVYESTLPYYYDTDPSPTYGDVKDLAGLAYGNDVFHVKGVYDAPMSSRDAVKQLIVDYGAVASSYYHNDNENRDYKNNGDTTGYFLGTANYRPNHAITIVGWDDNYSASNFITTPPGNGAWIVKNSWNTWFGTQGYFYLSYYDGSNLNSTAHAFDVEAADKHDNNYSYDGVPGNWGFSTSESTEYANIFTASASDKEKIEAVSVKFMKTNTAYTVKVYKNSPAPGKSISNIGELVWSTSGTAPYAGYYTFDIPADKQFEVSKGENYAVSVVLNANVSMAAATTNIGIFYTYTNSSAMASYYNAGSSSWSGPSTVTFSDGQTTQYDFCIKALTSDVTGSGNTDPVVPDPEPKTITLSYDGSTVATSFSKPATDKLTFSAVDGATVYVLKAKKAGSSTAERLSTIAAQSGKTSYTVTVSLDEKVPYVYTVEAVDSQGNVLCTSKTVTGTSTNTFAFNTAAIALNADGKMVVSWTQISGATGYDIYLGFSGTDLTKVASVGAVGTYTSTITPIETLFYSAYVVAKKNTWTVKSNEVSIEIPEPEPEPEIVEFKLQVVSSVKATGFDHPAKDRLSCESVDGAVNYQYYVKSKSATKFKELIKTSSTSLWATLNNGAPYTYYVEALNSADQVIGYSNEVTGTSDISFDFNVSKSAIASDGTITLTWSNVDADSYDVYFVKNNTSASPVNVLPDGGESLSKTFTVEKGYLYSAYVVAKKDTEKVESNHINNIYRVLDQTEEESITCLDNLALRVRWKAVKNANEYAVYRKISGVDSDYVLLKDHIASTTSFDDKEGLSYNKAVSYKIVAYYNDGVGDRTVTSSSTVFEDVYFLKEALLSTCSFKSDTLTVGYEAITGATEYEIRWKDKELRSEYPAEPDARSTTTSATINMKQIVGNMYSVQITPVRRVNGEIRSFCVHESTRAALVNPTVANINVTEKKSNSITVSVPSKHCQIAIREENSADALNWINPSESAYKFENLQPGVQYEIYMKSVYAKETAKVVRCDETTKTPDKVLLITENPVLTVKYGQKYTDGVISGGKFTDSEDETTVFTSKNGTIVWETPDKQGLVIGETENVKYTFTPDDTDFPSVSGVAKVVVEKAKPVVSFGKAQVRVNDGLDLEVAIPVTVTNPYDKTLKTKNLTYSYEAPDKRDDFSYTGNGSITESSNEFEIIAGNFFDCQGRKKTYVTISSDEYEEYIYSENVVVEYEGFQFVEKELNVSKNEWVSFEITGSPENITDCLFYEAYDKKTGRLLDWDYDEINDYQNAYGPDGKIAFSLDVDHMKIYVDGESSAKNIRFVGLIGQFVTECTLNISVPMQEVKVSSSAFEEENIINTVQTVTVGADNIELNVEAVPFNADNADSYVITSNNTAVAEIVDSTSIAIKGVGKAVIKISFGKNVSKEFTLMVLPKEAEDNEKLITSIDFYQTGTETLVTGMAVPFVKNKEYSLEILAKDTLGNKVADPDVTVSISNPAAAALTTNKDGSINVKLLTASNFKIIVTSNDEGKFSDYIDVYVLEQNVDLGAGKVNLNLNSTNYSSDSFTVKANYGASIYPIGINSVMKGLVSVDINDFDFVVNEKGDYVIISNNPASLSKGTYKFELSMGMQLVKENCETSEILLDELNYDIINKVVLVNVIDTVPTVNIGKVNMNLFLLDTYSQAIPVSSTYGDIEDIEIVSELDKVYFGKYFTISKDEITGEFYVELDKNPEGVPVYKKSSLKTKVNIWVKGYSKPVRKDLTVATPNKKYSIKQMSVPIIKANSVNREKEAYIRIYNNTTKEYLSDLEITQVITPSAKADVEVSADGKYIVVTLDENQTFKNGETVSVPVMLLDGENWNEELKLTVKVKVNTVLPKIIMKKNAVAFTCNSEFIESSGSDFTAERVALPVTADYFNVDILPASEWYVESYNAENRCYVEPDVYKDATEWLYVDSFGFFYDKETGEVIVETKDKLTEKGTYKYRLYMLDGYEEVYKDFTITVADKVVIANVKASGKLNPVVGANSYLKLAVALKNTQDRVKDVNVAYGDYPFEITFDKKLNTYVLKAIPGVEVEQKTYNIPVVVTLEGGADLRQFIKVNVKVAVPAVKCPSVINLYRGYDDKMATIDFKHYIPAGYEIDYITVDSINENFVTFNNGSELAVRLENEFIKNGKYSMKIKIYFKGDCGNVKPVAKTISVNVMN